MGFIRIGFLEAIFMPNIDVLSHEAIVSYLDSVRDKE